MVTFEKELYEEIEKLPTKKLEANSVVLVEDTYVKEIPILVEGSIKVCKTDESGKEVILYRISPGESCILSITSCLNNKQCNATVYIEKESILRLIPADMVKEWMHKYKSWSDYVYNLYYERFDELLSLIDAIAFKQVDIRLINKLKEYQQKQGNKIKVTHQILAFEIGTAREVVSRLLKQLEKNNLLKLDRGVIEIIAPL